MSNDNTDLTVRVDALEAKFSGEDIELFNAFLSVAGDISILDDRVNAIEHRFFARSRHPCGPVIRQPSALAEIVAGLNAKIEAQSKRIAELETVNSRLVACMGRFMSMLDERLLLATEVQVELETAIQSKASRGFRFPITVVNTVNVVSEGG
jgi:hypothetical protein